MKLDVEKLDFEHEPIHIPESIQSYGYLFALSQDSGEIRVVSENVDELFIGNYKDLLGKNFFNSLKDETIFLKETHSRTKKKQTRLPHSIKFKNEYINEEHKHDFLAVVYDSADYFTVELEPA